MSAPRNAVRSLEATVTPEDEASILARTERLFASLSLIRSAASLLFDARTLYAMVRDATFTMSWNTKATILAALLYLVVPTDLTPDFIPGIGFIDDALVLRWVIKRLHNEANRYADHIRNSHRP
ncbi:MAG: DUF1232 domain-containing protein [Candidatus Kapabacteria bacterium]|jgi:uncharacterized membrane protein YkvA (DUF1232 family)|nr:DUF1232 domain-containing protein [Candidatus Kapabacteria bacterium]